MQPERTHASLRDSIYSHYARDFQDATDSTFKVETAARWGRAYDWYFRQWLPTERSADIGELACGHGRMLHFLRERGYTNLSAVDLSADQVALARQVTPNVTHGNALEWLREHRQSFDLLVAMDLIEHFTREEALLFIDLCFAALKPGGRLILQTPNADSPFGLQHRYNDMTHEWAFNANQLSRLLARAGFISIELRELGPVPWGYSAVSSVRWLAWRAIRGLLQFWNLAETGASFPVLTRVFAAAACKGPL
jgi:2-polyprenyl-3-methyl-5-hydroxy-6-metoxy-1,4-benzoquinol methylase